MMLHAIARPDLIFHIEKSFYVEGEQKWRLWRNQTNEVQQHFVHQAEQILQAIQENSPAVEFSLPEKVVLCDPLTNSYREEAVPSRYRHQSLHRGVIQRNSSTFSKVLQRLSDLQNSSHLSLSLSANILRYWIARLWLNQLPEGEPYADNRERVVESSESTPLSQADRYYPQWMLIDSSKQPLFSSPAEAEARIHSMEETLQSLLSMMAIDPEIVEEEAFRSRYTALMAQWIAQGRAYTEYLTHSIVTEIRRRQSHHTLNRGLRIRLPYFDDQLLEIQFLDIEVVPPGRIAFEECFLIQAIQQVRQRLSEDNRLSPSTREHILGELEIIETSFPDCAPYLPMGAMSPYYHWVSMPTPQKDTEPSSNT